MGKLKQRFFGSLRLVAALFLSAGLAAGILFAAEKDADGLFNFTSREVVSASEINENFKLLMARVKALEANQVPAGAVMAFAVACPAGWFPADGSSGTPDLRGVFLRGLNNFGVNADGQGLNVAGTNDPDTRAAGAFQDYQVGPHSHPSLYFVFVTTPVGSSDLPGGLGNGPNFNDGGTAGVSTKNDQILSNGGGESRPRNVALYFCVKQ